MQSKHRSAYLNIIGGAPQSIKRLFQDRVRIVYHCSPVNFDKDWWHKNKERIFTDFGTLADAPFNTSNDLNEIKGREWPDTRLVENDWIGGETPVVELVYETLTSSWTQEEADETGATENGLGYRNRTQVALPGEELPYDEADVGTATTTVGDKTYVLASVKDAGNDRRGKIETRWVEPGVLNVRVDRASERQRITVQAIGLKWEQIAPVVGEVSEDHRLIEDGIGNYDGLQTHDYTFEMSGSETIEVGENNLRAVRVAEFSETAFSKETSGQPGTTTMEHRFVPAGEDGDDADDQPDEETALELVLAKVTVNNRAPLKSRSRTWVEPGILSVRTPLVGGQQQVVVQAVGLTQNQVGEALGDVSDKHKLVDISRGDYEGLQTSNHTFEVDDYTVTRTTESGLKQVTRTQLSANSFSDGKVGKDKYSSSSLLVLAGEEIDNGNSIKKRVSRWAMPGLVSVEESPGPRSIPGTKLVTYQSQGVAFYPGTSLTPVSSGGDADGSKAKLIRKNDRFVKGFLQYNRTYLVAASSSKTITGQKYSYRDRVNVPVPGSIECISIDTGIDGVTGSLADLKITPKGSKEIAVNVTIEIATSPPSGEARAFNIDSLSCSVLSKRESLRNGPGQTVTWGTENNRMSATGYSQAFSASAGVKVYPGYHLVSGKTSSNGTISYTGRSWYEVTNNTIGNEQSSKSILKTSCTGSGSTGKTGYSESGLVNSRPRPVYAALDGTVYWEIIKWETV